MKNPLHLAKRMAEKLAYSLWFAHRGYGNPVPRSTWDQQYKAGVWSFTSELHELGHYIMIAGYIDRCSEKPDILDFGCGHGQLLRHLYPTFNSYWGVDISSEAIAMANSRGIPNAKFETGSFDDWVAPHQFDVIVFNESLYYANKPKDIVEKYIGALKPGGKMVISMCEYGNHAIIWRKLKPLLTQIGATRIRNERGQGWHIRLFSAKRDSISSSIYSRID